MRSLPSKACGSFIGLTYNVLCHIRTVIRVFCCSNHDCCIKIIYMHRKFQIIKLEPNMLRITGTLIWLNYSWEQSLKFYQEVRVL